jgi:hypothetical protein
VRSLILAVALLLAAAGVAGAAPPPGDYGGGGAFAGKFRKGDSWMWARVGADGRARIGGAAKVPCGLVRFDAEVVPAADGAFRFTRVRRVEDFDGTRLRTVATVTGRFEGNTAAGDLYGRLRIRRPNGRVVRCTTGNPKPWQLRQPIPVTGPGAAQPTTTYLGLTSQQGSEPRPFVLRVGRNVGRVAFAMFEYMRQCRREQYFLNNVTPGAPIRADGTFSLRERFTLRYVRPRVAERFLVAVDGRFAAGAVTGTVRVTTVIRRRGSGRVVDRCDTGALTFSARV